MSSARSSDMQATTNAVAPVPSTASMSKWTVALWLSTFESAALSPSYTASSSASSSADCASSESDALPSEKSDGAPAVLLDASSLALRPPSDIAAAAQPTQLSLSLAGALAREVRGGCAGSVHGRSAFLPSPSVGERSSRPRSEPKENGRNASCSFLSSDLPVVSVSSRVSI